VAAKVAWGGYAASRPKAIALAVHGCEPGDAFEKTDAIPGVIILRWHQ
jgi:hypothetical protein